MGSRRVFNCKNTAGEIHFCRREQQPCGLEKTNSDWAASGKAKRFVLSFLLPGERGGKLAKCDIEAPNIVLEQFRFLFPLLGSTWRQHIMMFEHAILKMERNDPYRRALLSHVVIESSLMRHIK